jgi:hypothetical protein
MRHCTDQQQHTTQYPPTPLNTAFKYTINRTAWLPTTHKAQHKERKTVAPLAGNVYHLPKITEETTTQKVNSSAHKHDHKWAKFTCIKNNTRISNKKIFRNLSMRTVYILNSITMQNLTAHSNQQDQFHSSTYKS